MGNLASLSDKDRHQKIWSFVESVAGCFPKYETQTIAAKVVARNVETALKKTRIGFQNVLTMKAIDTRRVAILPFRNNANNSNEMTTPPPNLKKRKASSDNLLQEVLLVVVKRAKNQLKKKKYLLIQQQQQQQQQQKQQQQQQQLTIIQQQPTIIH